MNQVTDTETAGSNWKGIYKIGGATALIIVGLYLIETIGFVAMGPAPAIVDAWFTLFQKHGLLGLFDSYLLDAVAGLIVSVVMLRNKTFNKVTAYAGILANVFQLAEPPVILVPANFYQNIGLYLILISFVFFVIWYILIARTLFRLEYLERKGLSQQL